MRVLVLGSGVIGTSVAYFLSRSGHEVTVINRQPGPALETSYANAGRSPMPWFRSTRFSVLRAFPS